MNCIDEIVDQFVEKVNSNDLEPGLESEIPPSLRIGSINDNWYKWKIKRYNGINWIEELEINTKNHFPNSYKSFITRYIFPYFEIEPIQFLGNTPEGIDFELHELRTGIFNDKVLSKKLLANGYVQFGRPDTDRYDPICFDTKIKTKNNEYPIVQIDHEGIFIKSKIIVVKEIASSFLEFMENYLKNKV